ncbi:MAG: DUF4440 domain-containing protein [Gemmatimonadetes bacterium]|nr:DUF4440 domain-containing protein [Gemmatimonadota bacterium]
MKRFIALGTGLLTLACGQNKETPTQMQVRMQQEADAAKTAMAAEAKDYERWTAMGQADSIANMFTEDGRQMQPNGPALVGRDAIRESHGKMYATYDAKISLNTETVVANGPLAVERGTYQLQLNPKQGAPKGTPAVMETGKYLTHWELVNGSWKIVSDIWNSDQPPAGPVAASAKKR